MFEKGDKCKHKVTGEVGTIVYVSNEIVTIKTKSSLLPMRRFVFLQDYEVLSD